MLTGDNMVLTSISFLVTHEWWRVELCVSNHPPKMKLPHHLLTEPYQYGAWEHIHVQIQKHIRKKNFHDILHFAPKLQRAWGVCCFIRQRLSSAELNLHCTGIAWSPQSGKEEVEKAFRVVRVSILKCCTNEKRHWLCPVLLLHWRSYMKFPKLDNVCGRENYPHSLVGNPQAREMRSWVKV